MNLAGIFVLALVVRAGVAFLQTEPINIDEAYHYISSLNLTRGQGFTEHIVWNYLYLPESVVHPGFLYWMPLSSMIAALGLLLFGEAYSSAQFGFVLLSACLPVMTYMIAIEAGRNVRHAFIAALLMIFSGVYFREWTVIDSFTPFALFGVLALYGFGKLFDSRQAGWAIFAGVCTGLANLARPDGPLLLIAFAALLSLQWISPKIVLANRGAFSRDAALFVIAVGAFLLTMTPWYVRNFLLIGAATVPGGLDTIWLCSYYDFFSFGKDLGFSEYLACGWGTILDSKLWAVWRNTLRFSGEQGMWILLPLAYIGRKPFMSNTLFRLATVYGVLLFVAMSLVFTFPGARGSWYHSAGVLMPFLCVAAVQGIEPIAEDIARRNPNRSLSRAIQSGGIVLVSFAVIFSGFFFIRQSNLHAGEKSLGQAFAQAAILAGDNTVMVHKSPLYIFHGGQSAINVPTNGNEAIFSAADMYDATFLLLDGTMPDSLQGVYAAEKTHPRLALVDSFTADEVTLNMYKILGGTSDEEQN
ncbi:MAG: ArnT family glycosyltransferase [Gammaproteobacteria bacterium]